MKLNPTKCIFGVTSRKFLGLMVTKHGIEANQEKIQAILDMRHLANKKKIKQLTGRIASLSRFIFRSAERCLPFFKALRQTKEFSWMDDCQSAFEELKKYLTNPIILSKSQEGEDLNLYLAASDEAISSVLVRKDFDEVHKPIYYISKVLHDVETRYPKLQKIVYTLVISAKCLRPYFQSHRIIVLTDQPLRTVLQCPDTSGRMAKWAVKLSEYDITYQPRSAMKAQVLADFIVEYTWSDNEKEIQPSVEMEMTDASWILHVDGVGLILSDLNEDITEYALRFSFKVSNNQAKYEALLASLRIAKELNVRWLKVLSGSQLVVNQVKGDFEVHDATSALYLKMVRELGAYFDSWDISHVPRIENS